MAPTAFSIDRRMLLRLLAAAGTGVSGEARGEERGAQQIAQRRELPARVHGIAMHGDPALPPGFSHLPYASPNARKGGRLTLGQQGSFDSLNPFIIKGISAYGLRDFVFESLMGRCIDEPFSLYGLIAESVEVPADRSAITFHLRPHAKFSDGLPLTSKDVVFTWSALKEHGWPYQRSYYGKVASVDAADATTVRMTFDTSGDREMPLIMGLMPVLPSHRLNAESFERTTLEPPVGSGPYVVAAVEASHGLLFRRDPNHWARDLPIYAGRFNFNEIRVDYYRDPSALMEAFKTADIDLRNEDSPARWAEGYPLSEGRSGRIIKREYPLGIPAGMSGLVFNTRRSIFQDRRVRQALVALFDGAWINRTLYDGLYTRTESYFARSALASTGQPADEFERALLAPFPGVVPPDILEGRWRLPSTDGSGNNRQGLEAAHKLLTDAGYELDGRTLVNRRTKAPVVIEFLAETRAQERLMLTFSRTLDRVGIRVNVRQVDDAQYWARLKAFDFDVIQWTWGASLSPGNEQANRWSTKAAETSGSLNYAGVKQPAVDALIEAMLSATERPQFEAAVRALDRVLLAGDYVIPLFHASGQWIAHWTRIEGPERGSLAGADVDCWWVADR